MSRASTRRRQAFVLEYLVDHNAAQAAIRAGYSPRAAKEQGYRLLTNVHIQAAVEKAFRERAERVGLTADQVLAELKTLGLSNVDHYEVVDDAQRPVQLRPGAPPEAMRALSKVKRRVRTISRQDGTREDIEDVEYALWDKPTALRMAAEHLRLLGRAADDGEVRPIVYLDDVMLRKAAR